MRARVAIPALIVAAVLVPAVVQPAWELVARSIEGEGADRFAAILTRPAHLQALWNSVLLSLATVAAAAMLGVPLALLTRDVGAPGRWLGRLALAPLFLSPVLGTISFGFLFGRGGVLPHLLPGIEWNFRGFEAALLVHAMTMFVYFFLFVSAGLVRLDWDLVLAARSLGAAPLRVFRTVVMPLLRPALFAAAALTFMASMASFTAPYVFGGTERYLTTAIFIARKDDPALASALALMLATASLACAFAFAKGGGAAAASTASKGAAAALAAPRPLVTAGKVTVAAALVLATLAPLLTLVILSFKPQGRIGSEPLFAGLTTIHYQAIVHSLLTGDRSGPAGDLAPSIARSLVYATIATLANVAFALLLVTGVPERWRRTKRLLTSVSMLPIAIPGTVLALALLECFAAQGPFGVGPALAQTAAILPFAYFVRNLPILVQATLAAEAQVPPSLPEASRILGAGPIRTLFRVTGPLMLPGIASGAVVAFLAATGEFVASILLYTPRTQPAPVAIYAEYSQGEGGTAAAAGALLIVVVLLVAGAVQLAVRIAARGRTAVTGPPAFPRPAAP